METSKLINTVDRTRLQCSDMLHISLLLSLQVLVGHDVASSMGPIHEAISAAHAGPAKFSSQTRLQLCTDVNISMMRTGEQRFLVDYPVNVLLHRTLC